MKSWPIWAALAACLFASPALAQSTPCEYSPSTQTFPAGAVRVQCDQNGNLKVTGTTTTNTTGGTLTDRSGTITLGGTAQQLAAANSSRRGYFVQNNSTGDLWVNTLATAVASQPSIKIPAGALYETPSTMAATGAVSIIGATTGQAFTAREW